MQKYRKNYTVVLDDMDRYHYRLRTISAISYVQDAFARFCASKGVAAYNMFPKNLFWVIAEFNIEFTNIQPYWSEEFWVNIWISELSKTKIYTDYTLEYKGKTIAKGNALWFLVDLVTRRPIQPDIISERFTVCNELVLAEHDKFIISDTIQEYTRLNHTINLSDLDFNGHVNNKSYINLAEMSIDPKFQKTYQIQKMRVRFNKESFLNDVLTCITYKTHEEKTIVHKIEKDGISICDILTTWIPQQKTPSILEYDLDVKKEP